MEEILKQILNKLNSLETEMKEGFLSVNKRIDKLDEKLDKRVDLLLEEDKRIFDSLDSKFEMTMGKLVSVNNEVNKIDDKVEDLITDVKEFRADADNKFEVVTEKIFSISPIKV